MTEVTRPSMRSAFMPQRRGISRHVARRLVPPQDPTPPSEAPKGTRREKSPEHRRRNSTRRRGRNLPSSSHKAAEGSEESSCRQAATPSKNYAGEPASTIERERGSEAAAAAPSRRSPLPDYSTLLGWSWGRSLLCAWESAAALSPWSFVTSHRRTGRVASSPLPPTAIGDLCRLEEGCCRSSSLYRRRRRKVTPERKGDWPESPEEQGISIDHPSRAAARSRRTEREMTGAGVACRTEGRGPLAAIAILPCCRSVHRTALLHGIDVPAATHRNHAAPLHPLPAVEERTPEAGEVRRSRSRHRCFAENRARCCYMMKTEGNDVAVRLGECRCSVTTDVRHKPPPNRGICFVAFASCS
nr:hypothetical protein Iba_chr02aCG10210 [Ipomoea batatas]